MNYQLYIKKTLLGLVVLVLWLPLLQSTLHYFTPKKLNGAITYHNNVNFTFKGWMDKSYQGQKEIYLLDTFGLRNYYIRLNNQIAFTLFKKAKANGVLVGKENYVYEYPYIDAVNGKNYVGDESLKILVERLRFVQDTLSKLNKALLVVLGPGKASYYPEFVPDGMLKNGAKTNYDQLVKLLNEKQINIIDFRKWFLENKNKSKYPLYSKQGTHWSIYGAHLAADSIIMRASILLKETLPTGEWVIDSLQEAKGIDMDIADAMNLFQEIKGFKMAYPRMVKVNNAGLLKKNVLSISDSFFWEIYNYWPVYFNKINFWYYFKEVYPENFATKTLIDDIDALNVLKNADIIVIMAGEATVGGLGWGCVDFFYNYYTGNKEFLSEQFLKKRINEITQNMYKDPIWLNQIKEKAAKENVPLDTMLLRDALWIIDNERK